MSFSPRFWDRRILSIRLDPFPAPPASSVGIATCLGLSESSFHVFLETWERYEFPGGAISLSFLRVSMFPLRSWLSFFFYQSIHAFHSSGRLSPYWFPWFPRDVYRTGEWMNGWMDSSVTRKCFSLIEHPGRLVALMYQTWFKWAVEVLSPLIFFPCGDWRLGVFCWAGRERRRGEPLDEYD